MRGGGVFKAAVAFAVGIVVGCLGLAPSLAGSADSRVAGLSTAVAQARGELEAARAQLRSADSVVLDVGRETLAGTLAERSVMVVYAGGARDADVTKVRGLLADAGARDAGSMRLREEFFTPAMKNIASNVLPAGATLSEDKLDVGTHAGEVLGSLVFHSSATDEEHASGLGTLRNAGFLTYGDGGVKPADAVVLIVGPDVPTEFLTRFAPALGSRGGGLVVAGDTGSAQLAALQGRVVTVDSIDRATGQFAVVRQVALLVPPNDPDSVGDAE